MVVRVIKNYLKKYNDVEKHKTNVIIYDEIILSVHSSILSYAKL